MFADDLITAIRKKRSAKGYKEVSISGQGPYPVCASPPVRELFCEEARESAAQSKGDIMWPVLHCQPQWPR